MNSTELEPGQKVLHDNVGKTKMVFDTIYMADEQLWLVLFTDSTYVLVPTDFVWTTFE